MENYPLKELNQCVSVELDLHTDISNIFFNYYESALKPSENLLEQMRRIDEVITIGNTCIKHVPVVKFSARSYVNSLSGSIKDNEEARKYLATIKAGAEKICEDIDASRTDVITKIAELRNLKSKVHNQYLKNEGLISGGEK